MNRGLKKLWLSVSSSSVIIISSPSICPPHLFGEFLFIFTIFSVPFFSKSAINLPQNRSTDYIRLVRQTKTKELI